MLFKNKDVKKWSPNESERNLDDSRPSTKGDPVNTTFESSNSQKKGFWKKLFKKTYSKNANPGNPGTATTDTKTPNPSHEEESKNVCEELNVQIIEDNEQFNRMTQYKDGHHNSNPASPSEGNNSEEPEDVSSFVT